MHFLSFFKLRLDDRSISPSSRSLDSDCVVFLHFDNVFAAKTSDDFLFLGVFSEKVHSPLSWLTPFQSIGSENSSFTQNWDLQRLQEDEFPDNTITTFELTFSTWILSYSKLVKYDWILELQMLNIRDPRIGHMDLACDAIETLSGPCASSNGLIIADFIIAK